MNNGNINNGYLCVIHYKTGDTRHLGPFPSTISAFDNVKEEWKLKIHIPQKEIDKANEKGRNFRPVIGRKYMVNGSKDGIVAIEISVLEIYNLFSKGE